jgi:hypothetical protein
MKRFLILESIVVTVIFSGGWLFGARTLLDFSQVLLWSGLAIMGFGLISLVGQWGARTDSTYLVARTAADQDGIDRAHQSFSDIRASFSFLFETLSIGGIPLFLGVVLNALAR